LGGRRKREVADEASDEKQWVSRDGEVHALFLLRLEAGGWRLEAGGWRLEAGGWRLEATVGKRVGVMSGENV
jgi:hypothetical protein